MSEERKVDVLSVLDEVQDGLYPSRLVADVKVMRTVLKELFAAAQNVVLADSECCLTTSMIERLDEAIAACLPEKTP